MHTVVEEAQHHILALCHQHCQILHDELNINRDLYVRYLQQFQDYGPGVAVCFCDNGCATSISATEFGENKETETTVTNSSLDDNNNEEKLSKLRE